MPRVSSTVASRRTRCAHSATVVVVSPSASAVTIDLCPKYCSARWNTCGRASGRSCMSPSIGSPVAQCVVRHVGRYRRSAPSTTARPCTPLGGSRTTLGSRACPPTRRRGVPRRGFDLDEGGAGARRRRTRRFRRAPHHHDGRALRHGRRRPRRHRRRPVGSGRRARSCWPARRRAGGCGWPSSDPTARLHRRRVPRGLLGRGPGGARALRRARARRRPAPAQRAPRRGAPARRCRRRRPGHAAAQRGQAGAGPDPPPDPAVLRRGRAGGRAGRAAIHRPHRRGLRQRDPATRRAGAGPGAGGAGRALPAPRARRPRPGGRAAVPAAGAGRHARRGRARGGRAGPDRAGPGAGRRRRVRHHRRPLRGRRGARRTVEGDLGVRAAAGGVLVEGQAEGIVDPVEADLLAATVSRMAAEVGYVPRDPGSAAEDRRIAALAAVIAVRRHLRAHAGAGRDVGLVVLSGGVFRQRDPGGLSTVVATLRSDPVLATALDGVLVSSTPTSPSPRRGCWPGRPHRCRRGVAAGPPAGLTRAVDRTRRRWRCWTGNRVVGVEGRCDGPGPPRSTAWPLHRRAPSDIWRQPRTSHFSPTARRPRTSVRPGPARHAGDRPVQVRTCGGFHQRSRSRSWR